LFAWEQRFANVLHLIRLDSIKRKILVFSLLATLIPSLSVGWIFSAYANRFLTEKVAQQLRDITAQNVREIDLWLKERLYEVRVFSGSYEVSENLEKLTRSNPAPDMNTAARRRMNDYLKSVREKFIDYEELLVVNPNARVIATSTDRVSVLSLPPDWQKRAKADIPIMGEAYRDEALKKVVMLIAVPIKTQDGRFLGVLAVKLNFRTIEEILSRSRFGNTGHSFLIAQDGALIAGSESSSSDLMNVTPPFDTARPPSELEAVLLEYPDSHANLAIGVLRRMSQLDWNVVAQIEKEEVYAQTFRIRKLTIGVCLGLLLAIGLAAYILGLTIVHPLDRLTNGAAKVAAGDLVVKLPVISRGEVGYLTEAFNNMVTRLRQGQEALAAINTTLAEKNKELHVLSITDGLTGLHNRKHFMEVLAHEMARARRHTHPFSVMMVDIDHFKQYNDTFGHQAGDDLLRKIGAIFTETLRSVDCASRYGGDEFIVLLPEVGAGGALDVANRIRERVTAEVVNGDTKRVAVTATIGVACFPEHGETPEAIIASADGALYDAKRNGRNRVLLVRNTLRTDIGAA